MAEIIYNLLMYMLRGVSVAAPTLTGIAPATPVRPSDGAATRHTLLT